MDAGIRIGAGQMPGPARPNRCEFAELAEQSEAEMIGAFGKNGDYRRFSNHISLIRDSAGRQLYRDGNIRDLSERHKA